MMDTKIRLMRTTIAQGQHIDEQGVNYSLVPRDIVLDRHDISCTTRGYYRGSQELVDAELRSDCRLANDIIGEPVIVTSEGDVIDDVGYAMCLGLIVVEEE